MLKINYIKAHFVTSTPNISLVNKYFRASHNIKIATFLDYGNLKVTLMGKEFQFVNVTGASQISVIENFMSFYLSKFKVKQKSGIMIDSISATYKFSSKSKLCFEQFRKNLSNFELSAKDNSKFPGVTIRNKFNPKGGCAIYFRSGSLNFIGFKHPKHIIAMKNKIKSSLF